MGVSILKREINKESTKLVLLDEIRDMRGLKTKEKKISIPLAIEKERYIIQCLRDCISDWLVIFEVKDLPDSTRIYKFAENTDTMDVIYEEDIEVLNIDRCYISDTIAYDCEMIELLENLEFRTKDNQLVKILALSDEEDNFYDKVCEGYEYEYKYAYIIGKKVICMECKEEIGTVD